MSRHVIRPALLALALLALPSTYQAASAGTVEPSPVVAQVGDRTFYADGTVEVQVPAGTFSLGQCESGQFCVWSQPSYQGSFRYKTGTGTKALSGTVGSFWNNRSGVARLYNNTSSSSTCYENGVRKASVTSSYATADKVTLSTSTSC